MTAAHAPTVGAAVVEDLAFFLSAFAPPFASDFTLTLSSSPSSSSSSSLATTVAVGVAFDVGVALPFKLELLPESTSVIVVVGVESLVDVASPEEEVDSSVDELVLL